jgi:hypothetical protein
MLTADGRIPAEGAAPLQSARPVLAWLAATSARCLSLRVSKRSARLRLDKN